MEDKQGKDKLKEKLAAAVRRIQWSYAIFWCPSSSQPGVLEWGDGYYNGGIKTRRTILSNMEMDGNDQTIYQRSDQLRELYQSLISSNATTTTTQTCRPLAALSPEDLTSVEWFYLICMSFYYTIDQGLPGRCLESGQTIWLTNAHCVDTGVFGRSLLAKSAGVKTVVCFPLLNGVIELGTTELVTEDLNLIQLVKAALLEQGENMELMSPSGSCSNGFLFEHLGGVLENDQLSECISQASLNPEIFSPVPKSEDLQYQSAISSLFEKCDQGFLQQNLDMKSGFVGWKKGGSEKTGVREASSPQYMLKKILFEIPKMYLDESKKDGICKQEIVPNTNHVLAERRRREKVNERFSTLRSLIPSVSKADKISILDDTITYLKELERRIEELESSHESSDPIKKKKRKTVDTEERISENYVNDVNKGATKNKRKSKEIIKENEQECSQVSSKYSLVENTITISMVNEEILINISCLWRDSLLLQIIDAMTNLHLDSQSVHSSTLDGVLSLKIESKVKGSTTVSVDSITQTLLRVIRGDQA